MRAAFWFFVAVDGEVTWSGYFDAFRTTWRVHAPAMPTLRAVVDAINKYVIIINQEGLCETSLVSAKRPRARFLFLIDEASRVGVHRVYRAVTKVLARGTRYDVGRRSQAPWRNLQKSATDASSACHAKPASQLASSTAAAVSTRTNAIVLCLYAIVRCVRGL